MQGGGGRTNLITSSFNLQGVVTPIRTVVTAKTGVKKWSTGQGVFLPLVKGSRTIFYSLILQSNGQELFCRRKFRYGQTVKSLFALWLSGQAAKMTVKIS